MGKNDKTMPLLLLSTFLFWGIIIFHKIDKVNTWLILTYK